MFPILKWGVWIKEFNSFRLMMGLHPRSCFGNWISCYGNPCRAYNKDTILSWQNVVTWCILSRHSYIDRKVKFHFTWRVSQSSRSRMYISLSLLLASCDVLGLGLWLVVLCFLSLFSTPPQGLDIPLWKWWTIYYNPNQVVQTVLTQAASSVSLYNLEVWEHPFYSSISNR